MGERRGWSWGVLLGEGVSIGFFEGRWGNTFCLAGLRAASARPGLEVGVEMLGVLAGESRALRGLVVGEVVVGLRFEIGARRTGRVWVVVAGVCSCWG